MRVTIQSMKLALWERKEMDDRQKNPASGEWEKTGKKIEKTLYTLRDEFGDTLKFLSDNEYRPYEGQDVRVELLIEYNEFQNKNVVKLDTMESL